VRICCGSWVGTKRRWHSTNSAVNVARRTSRPAAEPITAIHRSLHAPRP
jgi:hypothetical protein